MTVFWTLVGTVGVLDEAGVWHRLAGRQPQAAFVLLAFHRDRAVPLSHVAELLWGETLPRHWRGAVRGVVAKVRSFLVEAGSSADALTSESGVLRLAIPPSTAIDVEEARSQLSEAARHLSAGHWEVAIEKADAAAAIVADDLLPGFDTGWVTAERAVLRSCARRALHVIAEAELGAGRAPQAVAASQALIDAEPFDEAAHRLLMRSHRAGGERKAALDAYETLRHRLDAELGVRPAPETEALHLLDLGEPPETSAPLIVSIPGGTAVPTAASGSFVGRSQQLAQLRDSWVTATATARARVILIEGEAGGGKTSLALELADATRGHGGQVLWGRCRSEAATAYEPVIEAVGRVLTEDQEAVRALGPIALDLAPLFPELYPAMAEPFASHGADPVARARLFRAVAATIAQLTTHSTLIVFDDLQWAGPDTLALLGHLAADLVNRPVLLVLTTRETTRPLAATLAGVGRVMPLEVLRLGGFDHDDLVELLTATGAEIRSRADVLAPALLTRTGGNPLFVSQFLRCALDSGGAVDTQAIPTQLRDWIGQRVAALEPAAAATLALAGVIGQEFDFEILAASSSVSRETLLDLCEDLKRSHFLAEEGRAGRFGFAHALVRDAVYDGLGPTRVALLHERVSGALSARPGAPGQLSQLAHHLARAGPEQVQRAQAAAVAAGLEALDQAAWDSAIQHLSDAVRLAGPEPDQRTAALIGLGRALRGADRKEESRAAFEEAIDLAARHELAERSADAVLGLIGGGGRGVAVDLPDDARADLLRRALSGLDEDDSPAMYLAVLGELALALLLTDQNREREDLARRALHLGRQAGDPTTMGRALLVSRLGHVGPEHTEIRLAETAELLALRDIPPDVTLAGLFQRHEDLLLSGDRDGADGALAEAAEIQKRYDHPYWRWVLTTWRGLSAIIDGDLDRAESLALEALGQRPEHPEAIACYGVNLVDIRLYQGRAEEMVDLLAAAIDDNPNIPAYRAVYSLCCAEAGRRRPALAAYRHFADNEFSNIPDDTNRLLTLAVLADVAATLDQRTGRSTLARLLEPHATRQVILNCFGGGGATWGPVAHQLGRFAALDGDRPAADRWFDQAAERASTIRSFADRDRINQQRR